MSTTTASVSNVQTIALRTDALILQHYAEIARYAVQLAITRLSPIASRNDDRELQTSCDVCLSLSPRGESIVHDDSCTVGRVFRLAVEIDKLETAAHERTIEYFPTTSPLGELHPGRTVTHELAARLAAVEVSQ